MRDLPSAQLGTVELASALSFALDQINGASKAIAHPLGFTMLEQVPDGQGGYRRIHLWRAERSPGMIPHSHSGDLRSTILIGAMRNYLWEVGESGPAAMPIVEVEKIGPHGRAYRAIGNARFRITSRADFGFGQTYIIPAGAYHSNEVLSEVCVTYVERRRSTGALAQVARSLEEAAALDRVPERLAKFELAEIAAELQARVAGLGSCSYPEH